MPWREVPEFVSNIDGRIKVTETTRLALEFLILTAARSGEVRNMVWAEVDLEERMWTIPAARMKASKTHRVPLCNRAIEILQRMGQLKQSDLVFEGAKPGRPLSDMSLTMPLRRAGLRVTVHGFRSSFRDWAAEATDTPREVAEAALAHVLSNKAEAAYARTDYYEKRRKLMNQWGGFIAGDRRSGATMA